MKTRYFSFLTLCGLLAGATPLARANDTVDSQPAVTASVNASLAAPQFSGRIDEVVKLAQSGVDESVVTSYINASPGPFQPSAEEIIKLRDSGISPTIITAMLERGAELRVQQNQLTQVASQTPAPVQNSYGYAQPAPVVAPQTYAPPVYEYSAPASTVVYIGGSYGYPSLGYRYGYPYYYSSYYYPRVGFYGGFYPRFTVNARFGGGFHGGFGGTHFSGHIGGFSGAGHFHR